jgi:hypothetical protein
LEPILNKFFKFLHEIYRFKSQQNFDDLKFLIGQNSILASRARYTQIQFLHEAEVKIFSQWGEDGIIDYLLHILKISKPRILEIGVGDFTECNSRFAAEFMNASVYMVDINKELVDKVIDKNLYWKTTLYPQIDRVTPDNAQSHFESALIKMRGIDLLSIDIDGNDFWVLEALDLEKVSIVICEYNPVYGSKIACTIIRNDNYDRSKSHFSYLHFGMSLRAAILLLKRKGFIFVGSNLVGNNAFFVREELRSQIKLQIPDLDQLEFFVDWRIRESRSRDGDLNFLSLNDSRKEIQDCSVYDIEAEKIIKVRDIKYGT